MLSHVLSFYVYSFFLVPRLAKIFLATFKLKQGNRSLGCIDEQNWPQGG